MKNIILSLAVVFVLLFGCLGGNEPPQNQTPQVNQTPNVTTNISNVTIIVNPQQNQTVEQNYTPPLPPEIQSNETNYTVNPEENFAVYFLYVGDMQNKLQGDAILIKKGDFDVLVDAGPAQSSGKLLDFLKSRGIDDIDVLVSTTADPFRYGGMEAVASYYNVEEFWWSGKDFEKGDYQSLVASISQKAKAVNVLRRGSTYTLNGMTFTALNPKDPQFKDVNNDALVLRMEDRNFSLVLLSNVQFGAQSELVNNQKDLLKVNVMEAPYYGLGVGTSGIANFLQQLRPENVVISGGPDESAASGGSRDPFKRLLDEYKIKYYENYASGTVRVMSDGTSYSVSYFK